MGLVGFLNCIGFVSFFGVIGYFKWAGLLNLDIDKGIVRISKQGGHGAHSWFFVTIRSRIFCVGGE